MKALLQRVAEASVTVGGEMVSSIGGGLLVLLGVAVGDDEAKADAIARKIAQLRIFEDEAGKMNLSVADVGGEVLVVSQFTLMADCRKGNRPSFVDAARPEEADALYMGVVAKLRERLGEGKVKTGVFRTHMEVRLLNDGPVTIALDV
ncbi:MAG: D-tyrosyl-tRNA(Tyr) deacylase [Kiritimatiellae bacterium]|nr:D-tyrosyl-tRNA(Tyr) deacylase [Kiritimatiellia bacterium]